MLPLMASPGVVMRTVCPSGAALATASAPTLPPAPARFSTTTGCLKDSDIFALTQRATVSTEPPAGNGTTMRTGRFGNDWACAFASASASNKGGMIRCRFKRWPRLSILSLSAGPKLMVRIAHDRGVRRHEKAGQKVFPEDPLRGLLRSARAAARRCARRALAARGRGAHSCRRRHALRRIPAPFLAAVRAVEGRSGAPEGGEDPRRGAGALPRRKRPARLPRAALQPPRHLARVRRAAAARHPLLLPRLALRCGWHHPRHADRGGGQPAEGEAVPPGVPDARAQRAHLRLHGAAGEEAVVPDLRHLRRARLSR